MSYPADPIDLEGRRRVEAETARREALAREEDEADLKWLMSDKKGRRFLWRLLETTGVDSPIFNTNYGVMAHNEGARSIGLFYRARFLKVSPESEALMRSENTT